MSGGHSDTSTVNDVCFTSQNTIAVTEGAITISSIEPSNTVDGRGPTSYHKEMTLTFSTENGIPDGGKIVLLMDSDWEPTLSTCKV